MDDAEFDKFADEYKALHAKNIRISGESPDFFAEYKIFDIFKRCNSLQIKVDNFLDFGGGIGVSVDYIQKYFPNVDISLVDVSRKSLDIARNKYSHGVNFIHFDGYKIPLENKSQDVVMASCVFHHIEHGEHVRILMELNRVLKKTGHIWIFEHNPYNPLTQHAVNTCPFDENAALVSAGKLCKKLRAAGFIEPIVYYRIFFPHALRALRKFEPWLRHVPLGAQYFVEARLE